MVSITRLTRSGQLTMPAAVRRELGLSAGDPVLWTKDAAGHTIVRSMRLSLDDLDGFLPVIDHPSAETDFGDMIDEAQEDLVDALAREINPE